MSTCRVGGSEPADEPADEPARRDGGACEICGSAWWDCEHGAARPAVRQNPWLVGFVYGVLAGLVAGAALAAWRWLGGA